MKSMIIRLLAITVSLTGYLFGQNAGQNERSSGVIGQLDTIEVRVYREDDLNTRSQLSADGTITMPFIGAVKVAGMSTDQAAALITRKLEDGWLVKPEVSVSIEARIRRTVTVLGQAQRPGVFEIAAQRRLTLVEAVGMAGGVTRIANSKKITLKRGGNVTIVNLADISSGKGADIPLQDGDVISIPEGIF